MATPRSKRVKILSDVQLRKTLSGSKKDQSGVTRKSVIRTALKNPHAYTWPVMEADVQGAILKELVEFCTTNHNPPPSSAASYRSKVSERRAKYVLEIRKITSIRPKLPEAERSAKIAEAKKRMKEDLSLISMKKEPKQWSKGTDKRVLAIGVNQVMKRAENGDIAAIFVDAERSVTLVTNALAPMCAARNLPGVAVKELNNSLGPILRIKSVTCIGILSSVDPECPVIELAKKHGKIAL